MLSKFLAAVLAIGVYSSSHAQSLSPAEAKAIATEAFTFFYPLVTMEITRQQLTNIEAGKMVGRGPMNTFSHMRSYPTADFREVVRPNFDTLYSSAWLDLTKEPVIISMPATNGRYYLLPVLDMWSDVLGAPGSRTSGTAAQNIAVIPPGWQGSLPAGVMRLQSTTPYAWLIGRIQTNGAADYPAVHAIQNQMTITLLSNWGKPPVAPIVTIDPNVDMKTAPLDQVNAMSADKYFALASELLKKNPAHLTDWSQIERLKRLGLNDQSTFNLSSLPADIQTAVAEGAREALQEMVRKIPTLAPVHNGWGMNTTSMGVYGNYYLKRAIVTMVGLGANQPEDAIYPIALVDDKGDEFVGSKNYVLHFEKSELPPNFAFWSLTMYDKDGFQVGNEINRFAIGSADKLQYNADGSLDIYIQNKNPGPSKVSNWLPSPASGVLGMTMRLYAPAPQALDGRWNPPAIRVQ